MSGTTSSRDDAPPGPAEEPAGRDRAAESGGWLPPGESLGQRVERSTPGRVLIGALVAVVFAIIVVWNLPDSALRSAGLDVVRPVANVTGLDQNWRVFAPNPRRISLDLYALVEFADGEVVTWRVPDESEPFVSPYRTYRWRKWMEHVRLDDKRGLWRPAAEWIARQFTTEDRRPVRVSLVRRWYDIPQPGSGDETPPWNEYTYYELDLP